MLKTENKMFIFSCDYANMTSLVTPRMFSAFKEGTQFSCLTWIFKFRMQTAFQINLLPFPTAYIKRYIGMDFSSNMAATINL